VEAAHQLGLSYEAGKGFPRDHGEAAKWYQMAAQQGNGDAQFRLGAMLPPVGVCRGSCQTRMAGYRLRQNKGRR
jgi:TPR repeat protein